MNLAESRKDCTECQGDTIDRTDDQRRDNQMTQESNGEERVIILKGRHLGRTAAVGITEVTRQKTIIADLVAALEDLAARAERAKTILRHRDGMVDGHTTWNMLDTQEAREALAKAKGETA